MLVLRPDDSTGKPFAFLVNYSVHNNAVSKFVVSSDFFGYMSKVLGMVYGDDLVVLPLASPCGNTNWLNHNYP